MLSIRSAIGEFEARYRIPQITGAIDGCHFEIKAPEENMECYFNRKQVYSVNLQGIADSPLKFIDISVGYPGNLHDARAFSLSLISIAVNNRELMTWPFKQISRVSVGPMLAGDSPYPLNSYILKPLSSRRRLTIAQVNFLKRFCALRSAVERGFGLLKNRWRLLYKLNEQKLQNLIKSITAACVLHNVCLVNEETLWRNLKEMEIIALTY